MKKHIFIAPIVSILSFFAIVGATHASTEQSTTIAVSGDVANACSITSSSSLDFGTTTPNQPVTKTGTVSVNCNNGVSYTVLPMPSSATTVALTGNLADNTPVNDSISYSGSSGHNINTRFGLFQLYKDAGATQIWRNFGTDFISGTGTGANQDYTIAIKFTPGANGGNSTGKYNLQLNPTVVF